MVDDDSSCFQKVNIETECVNTLNAEYYSSKLKFYLGQAGKIADAKAFEVAEVWKFDDANSVYTKSDASSLASKATKNGEDCTCENYLKEITYTVEIEKNSETQQYSPASIKANVVVGSQKITAKCSSSIGVAQKFKINFVSKIDAKTVVQKNSGNPGYIDGLPLKVGFQSAVNQPISSYQDGFEISGADQEGKCIMTQPTSSATSIIDYGDPVINFNEELSYGCFVKYKADALKTFCSADNSATVKAMQIFKNLDEFKKFGKFGNANILFPKDWTDMVKDASFDNLGKSQWDEASQTCSIYSSVLIKVIYSKQGFSENPHKYVKDVKFYAIQEKWRFPVGQGVSESDFSHFVNVQFAEVNNRNETPEGLIESTGITLNRDMFYPFYMRFM